MAYSAAIAKDLPIKGLSISAAIVFALVAGCGGSSEEPSEDGGGYTLRASTTMSAASPPLTKARFLARINRVCRGAWVVVLGNFRESLRKQDPAIGRQDRFAEAVRTAVLYGIDFYIFDDIRRLGSAPGEEREIEEMIGPFQIAVELGQIGRWRARSVDDIVEQFAKYNRHARRYGLVDCLVDRRHLKLGRQAGDGSP